MKQKEKRELLFRVLFGQSFNDNEVVEEEMLESYTKNDKEISEEDKQNVLAELNQIKKLLPEIDARIDKNIERWNTKTMARIELAILRLTVYEAFYKQGNIINVLANDAVTLASKYGQDASYRFVNGALANLLPEKKLSEGMPSDNQTEDAAREAAETDIATSKAEEVSEE